MNEPRISARVPEKARDLVHEAANTMGVTVSDFIAAATIHEAHKVLERERTLTVTPKYASAFLAALENPPEPNKALMTAAKRS